MSRPRLLVVAGSDSGGGAGLQADVKTAMVHGVHASTVVTAVTAQDSTGVHAVATVSPDVVQAQLQRVLADIGADAVKTGMLATADVVQVVATALAARDLPLVVDPVLSAGAGGSLLAGDPTTTLLPLLRLATVLTPNSDELTRLAGLPVHSVDDVAPAARRLFERTGPRWVLATGGHLPGADAVDVLTDGERVELLAGPRIDTAHTHGGGCTLSTALACQLAAGVDVPTAARAAKEFVTGAIRAGYPLGSGPGPVDQAWRRRDGVSG